MNLAGNKKSFSYSSKYAVIFGACSATVYTFLISSKSQTSRLRVRAFSRSLRLSSATTETSDTLTDVVSLISSVTRYAEPG